MVTWIITRFTLLTLLRDRILLAVAFVLPLAAVSVLDTTLGRGVGRLPPRLLAATPGRSWAIYCMGALAALLTLGIAARGAALFLGEEESGVVGRLRVAPVGDRDLLAGRTIAMLVVSSIALLAFLLWGELAFNLHRVGHLVPFLLLAASAGWMSAGLGLLLASAVLSRRALIPTAGIAILIVSLLGGSPVPLTVLPSWIEWLGTLTPNRLMIWAIAALYGAPERPWAVLPLAFVLTIIGALALAGAAQLFASRWRRRGLLPARR